MKEKDQTNNPKNKEYPELEDLPLSVVNEPEALYETKPEISFGEADNIIPKGFMTSETFRRKVKEEVTKFYMENGLI
jgi:hypothetical protein